MASGEKIYVLTLANYLVGGDEVGWQGTDYAASNFVKALKGGPIIGAYSHIPVLNEQKHLTNVNIEDAIGWFGKIAADALDGAFEPGERLFFIPIPNSHVVSFDSEFQTLRMAQSLASELGPTASVLHILRNNRAVPPSHETAGVRNPIDYFHNYVCREPCNGRIGRFVLVDDMFTSGSHVRASEAILAEHGYRIDLAICAGRNVRLERGPPFEAQGVEIDRWRKQQNGG